MWDAVMYTVGCFVAFLGQKAKRPQKKPLWNKTWVQEVKDHFKRLKLADGAQKSRQVAKMAFRDQKITP